MAVKCDYCDRPAKLVNGAAIYPHRPDLAHKKFWKCDACDAWVGCHPKRTARQKGRGDGTLPMGRLANAELRKAKQAAHAAFDSLWKSGAMRRKQAYAWLAEQIGVSVANCHIGMFDVDGCKAVVAACQRTTVARCPQCDGSGVVEHGLRVVCCGRPTVSGECCGDPAPEPDIGPCQWCNERNGAIEGAKP